jgi:hypothetical protein
MIGGIGLLLMIRELAESRTWRGLGGEWFDGNLVLHVVERESATHAWPASHEFWAIHDRITRGEQP